MKRNKEVSILMAHLSAAGLIPESEDVKEKYKQSLKTGLKDIACRKYQANHGGKGCYPLRIPVYVGEKKISEVVVKTISGNESGDYHTEQLITGLSRYKDIDTDKEVSAIQFTKGNISKIESAIGHYVTDIVFKLNADNSTMICKQVGRGDILARENDVIVITEKKIPNLIPECPVIVAHSLNYFNNKFRPASVNSTDPAMENK